MKETARNSWRKSIDAIKDAWPHVCAVLIQISVPALIALSYSLYDWHSSGRHFNPSAFAKVFFPALFFVMWFVGMFERAKKRSSDKESFEGIKTDLRSLTSLVQQLKTIATVVPAAPHPQSPPTFSRSLMDESMSIFKLGYALASLLTAGVAFEQSVRAFARRRGVEEADRLPLMHLLNKIDWMLPPGWNKELHMLRKIRNQTAHATERDLSNIGDIDFLLRNYRNAINQLDPSNDVEQ